MTTSNKRARSDEDLISFSNIVDEEQLRAICGGNLTIHRVSGRTPLGREGESERVPHALLMPWAERLGQRLAVTHRQVLKRNEHALYPLIFVLFSHIIGILPNSEDFAVSVTQKLALQERKGGAEGEGGEGDREEVDAKAKVEERKEAEQAPRSKVIVGLQEYLRHHNLLCYGYAEFVFSQRIPSPQSTRTSPSSSKKPIGTRRIRRVVIEAKRVFGDDAGLFQLMGELLVCSQLNRELGCADPVYGFVTDCYHWCMVRYDGDTDEFHVWEDFKAFSSLDSLLSPKEGLRTLIAAFLLLSTASQKIRMSSLCA